MMDTGWSEIGMPDNIHATRAGLASDDVPGTLHHDIKCNNMSKTVVVGLWNANHALMQHTLNPSSSFSA